MPLDGWLTVVPNLPAPLCFWDYNSQKPLP